MMQVSEIRSDRKPWRSMTSNCAATSAVVTVRFVSDQVSLTRDKEGQPVAGTDAVTEITDLWTFERDLATA